ncbi:hypothetical protein CHARACLAT_016632 [Characodon lateralis]|uniref:Uncharacterized protein n=1 Tax=Characodon lateralis TaxID=208331 RepID=A0ABU7EA80_9TELE|nr:hypothetical protein [Characodon lateralis]
MSTVLRNLPQGYGWKKMTKRLPPCRTNGRMGSLFRLPTGKMMPLEKQTGGQRGGQSITCCTRLHDHGSR